MMFMRGQEIEFLNLHSGIMQTNESSFKLADMYILLIVHYSKHIMASCFTFWISWWHTHFLVFSKLVNFLFQFFSFYSFSCSPVLLTESIQYTFHKWFHQANVISVLIILRVWHWLNYKCWHSVWKAEVICFQLQSGSLHASFGSRHAIHCFIWFHSPLLAQQGHYPRLVIWKNQLKIL